MSDLSYSSVNCKDWTSFTPTVTLGAGSGNVVPVYSTNEAYYFRIGSLVFVEFNLSGDGGAEGAGSGVINISLPITASASQFPAPMCCGRQNNGTVGTPLYVKVDASATTFVLSRQELVGSVSNVTGANQNNTTRGLRGAFFYIV